MSKPFFTILSLGAAFALALPAPHATAQAGSHTAAQGVLQRFGPDMLDHVVRADASGGAPQPDVWEFRTLDPLSPTGLRRFTHGRRGATDHGAPIDGYPDSLPGGFFSWASVRVDSHAAFQIAEAQATHARISFNSLDYSLRAREGTRIPVWHISLRDSNNRIVGQVEISATEGEVLRRVWVRQATPVGRRAPGIARIEDSLSPIPSMAPPVPPPPMREADTTDEEPEAEGNGAEERERERNSTERGDNGSAIPLAPREFADDEPVAEEEDGVAPPPMPDPTPPAPIP